MTTMFVQLRRVVYLLVLLHFCTCAINSVSGNQNYVKQKEKRFMEMRDKLKELKSTAEEYLTPLDDVIMACNDNSSRADKAVEKLRKLVDAREEAKGPFASYTTDEEMEEQRKEEKAALQEGKALEPIVALAAKETKKTAEELDKTLTEMETISKTLISEATECYNSAAVMYLPSDTFFEVEKIVVDSTKEGESIEFFVAQEKLRAKTALDAAERAEKYANFLKVALELAEKEFQEEFWVSRS